MPMKNTHFSELATASSAGEDATNNVMMAVAATPSAM